MATLTLNNNNKQHFDLRLNLVIVGGVVGKTCLLLRYTEDSFPINALPTTGIDFKIKYIQLRGLNLRVQIWDTAGAERFRTITNSYFRGAHCVMIVYNVQDRRTFLDIKYWMSQVRMYGSETLPVIIVGNCCDVNDPWTVYNRVTYEEGAALAREYGCPFFECSAKRDYNVQEMFFKAVTKALYFVTIDGFKNLIEKGNFSELQKTFIDLPNTQASYVHMCDDDGYSLLMHAIIANQYEIAKWLIDHVALDVQVKNKMGATVLHVAATYAFLPLFSLCQQRGCDIFAIDQNNANVLMYCAKGDQRREVIDYCLSQGLNINSTDSNGYTALFHAINAKQESTIDYLLLKGADYQHIDKHGCNVLLTAAKTGSMQMIRLLNNSISYHQGLELDITSQVTQNVFIEVVKKGFQDVILWFLARGLDINTNSPERDGVLFEVDIININIITFLLQHGAFVDSVDKNGDTLMILAAKQGLLNLLRVLILDFHGDINKANPLTGKTPLMAAGSELSIVKWLVSHGADIHAVDHTGHNALFYCLNCVTNTVSETIRWYFTQPGMYINEQTLGLERCTLGKTYLELLIAIKSKKPETVESLLLRNHRYLYLDARDQNGRTLLMIAAKVGVKTIVQLLLKYHADINATDKIGLNSIAIAIQYGHSDCVTYLLSEMERRKNNHPTSTFTAVSVSNTRSKLIPEIDRMLSNMIVPKLVISLMENKYVLRSKVVPVHLALKQEIAQRKALEEKKSRRNKGFMRYFKR